MNAQSLDLLAKIEDQKIFGENDNSFLEYQTTDGEFKKTYFKSPKRERSSFNDTYISTLYLTSGEIGYCESNQRFLSPCFVKAVLDKGFDIYPQDELLIHAMNLNIFGIFIHPLKGIANVESFIKNFHFERVVVGESYLMDDAERIGDQGEEFVWSVNDFGDGFV